MNDDAIKDFDKPYQDYLEDQTKLRSILGKFAEKLRQGDGLEVSEQLFISNLANAMHAGAVGKEFQSRVSRVNSLARHFHHGVALAALDKPDVADCLEAVIATGKRENGWVLSADIRRSTELMLRARDASLFATFLSALCERINSGVTNPCGYFDKFTGDGCLAFFPDSLCGGLSELFALDAAARCHNSFWRVLSYYGPRLYGPECPPTGLGLGLAYGEIQFVEIANQKTIVGESVVWACRLSSGPAGTTYLTQDAMARICQKYPQLKKKFRIVRRNVKPKGRLPVAWWRGDLTDYPELELQSPEWFLDLYPNEKVLAKTRLEGRSSGG